MKRPFGFLFSWNFICRRRAGNLPVPTCWPWALRLDPTELVAGRLEEKPVVPFKRGETAKEIKHMLFVYLGCPF
jgi:hypothetical protein